MAKKLKKYQAPTKSKSNEFVGKVGQMIFDNVGGTLANAIANGLMKTKGNNRPAPKPTGAKKGYEYKKGGPVKKKK